MPRRDAKRFPRWQPSMENSKAPSPAGSKFRQAGGIFLPRAVPKGGTMAERKQRRWLAKRAGSLLFVCRDARRPDGLFESLPEAPESNKKRRGFAFPQNLIFGALEGTLPRPCGQSAGLSAPAGTQGGRTGCSSPFRRLPETTKKKRFLVSLEPLLWCAGRDSNPRPSDS